MKLEKKITNVQLTTQTGTSIVSANPTDKSAQYITALDNVTGGSKYAKMELDQSLLYGSSLETTYEITLKNDSEKDYIEDDDSEYGHYYYYGEKTEKARAKVVTVNEVVDTLDDKYKLDTSQTTITGSKCRDNKDNGTSTTVNITKNDADGSTETTNTIKLTGWEKLESEESETVTYKVTSLLSSDDDLAYTNKAQVTSITLDKLTTLRSDFKWEKCKDTTTITLSKPTGADKRPIYWGAATIGLIVIAAGIVFIKKKVLKK